MSINDFMNTDIEIVMFGPEAQMFGPEAPSQVIASGRLRYYDIIV